MLAKRFYFAQVNHKSTGFIITVHTIYWPMTFAHKFIDNMQPKSSSNLNNTIIRNLTFPPDQRMDSQACE
jgi:hypothetical protein